MSRVPDITVIVADDDEDVREAIAGIVEDEPGLGLVGKAADSAQAIALAGIHRPNVAMIDVNMPGGGSNAARGIKRVSPTTKVLVLSGHGDRDTVMRMLEAGADGYLVKSSGIDAIVGAIKGAVSGQASLSPEVTKGVIQELAEELGRRRDEVEKERRVAARVQRVLDDGILGMVYQPIVRLEDGVAMGVEALSRFYGRPRRGPDKWYADAEMVGLGTKLELKALGQVLDCLADIPGHLYVSVNLTPGAVVSAALRRCLADYEDCTRLVVEVTEHVPIENYPRVTKSLDGLRERGIRVAIDDVGAGFASLRHILRLAPDFIKLDRELVSGVGTDRSLQALASGLITFANRIGATVIAEGVEEPDEVMMLAGLGVRFGQGYHFAKPQPLPLALP